MPKSISLALLAIVSIFAPIKASLLAIGVLVFSDMALGIIAAKKRKEPITSAELRRSVSKLFIFEVALILGFIIEKYMLDGSFPIIKILSNFIGLVELKSIMENLNDISGQNLLSVILSKLDSKNKAVASEDQDNDDLPPAA